MSIFGDIPDLPQEGWREKEKKKRRREEGGEEKERKDTREIMNLFMDTMKSVINLWTTHLLT